MATDRSLHSEALLVSQRARALGLTQSIIAERLSASQSQVSRILAGTSKRRSKLFDAVCKYVFSFEKNPSRGQIGQSEELNDALASVWDGTPEHAHALALVIRSLGVLHPDRRSLPINRLPLEVDSL